MIEQISETELMLSKREVAVDVEVMFVLEVRAEQDKAADRDLNAIGDNGAEIVRGCDREKIEAIANGAVNGLRVQNRKSRRGWAFSGGGFPSA